MTTMNSNERKERLKQIRERWSRMNMPQTVFTSHCKGDIDFLLSLLDSQTTEDVDFEHYWDEYQRPWLPNGIAGYEHAKKAWANAATQMREACVAKVRAAGQWCDNCPHRAMPANADGSCSAYGYNGVDCQAQPCACRSHNPESQHYGMLVNALESLTLDVEQKEAK